MQESHLGKKFRQMEEVISTAKKDIASTSNIQEAESLKNKGVGV